MNWIEPSDRLKGMPPYIFSEINQMKAQALKEGKSLLSVAIGDPDQPTPQAIVEKLVDATRRAENHVYSPYEGTLNFRKGIAAWFEKRFQVSLNPEREILALIGSKEGVAHFPLAFCNPGDRCLFPSPGYPIFSTSILLAGGIPVPIPHKPENQFLPDLVELAHLLETHRPRYMLFNFPSNPTSAVCPREVMEAIVTLAHRYQTILVSDNAYSEMYFDAQDRPLSFLNIDGAKDVTIEFHSLSKTFNMTGWRVGFAVGNEALVSSLGRVKTHIDSGPLMAVQEASLFALETSERLTAPIREVYRKRRDLLIQGLDRLGIEYLKPKATFFVWAKVPGNMPSMEFTKRLIKEQGLVVTPGIGFGPEGEGFFRMALTVSERDLTETLERLRRFLAG